MWRIPYLSQNKISKGILLWENEVKKAIFFLHRHCPICILKQNNKDSWVLLFVVNSIICLYATFSLQIQTVFQLVLSILLASWSLFSTKVQVGNQLTLLFHFAVTHYRLNMQLQCIYMEICSERKTNRKDPWELAAGWVIALDFLACFCSEAAGLGGEEKERRGETREERGKQKMTKI